MLHTFLQHCDQEAARLEQPGVVQLAGFALERGEVDGAACWYGLATERAMLGILAERVCSQHRKAGGERDALERISLWRGRKRERKLEDLARDLVRGRRDARSLQGLSPNKGGRALEHRHIDAAERALEKSAQRRNLSRLFALSERLAALFECSEGVDLLEQIDALLEQQWGCKHLLRWMLCSRFRPLGFKRRLMKTQLVIASLYVGEREFCGYTGLETEDARRARVDLLVALRQINRVMGWDTIGDAFPERLVMTQGDLKQRREDGDDDDPRDGDQDLADSIRELAARATSQAGDERLWQMMREDPNLHTIYARERVALEERAEDALLAAESRIHRPSPVSSPTWLERWWRSMLLAAAGAAVAAAMTLVVLDKRASRQVGEEPAVVMGSHDLIGPIIQWSTMMMTRSQAAMAIVTAAFTSLILDLQPDPVVAQESDASDQSKREETAPSVKKIPSAGKYRELEVEMFTGTLTLSASKDGQIHHSYKVRRGNPDHCKVIAKDDDGKLELEQKNERRFGKCEVDLTISLPPSTPTELEVSSGGVKLADLTGPLDIEIASGSLSCERLDTRSMEVSLSNGSLNCSGVVDRGDFKISNGSLKFSMDRMPAAGHLSAKLSNGTAAITLPSDARINTDLTTTMGQANSDFQDDDSASFAVDVTASMGSISIKKR